MDERLALDLRWRGLKALRAHSYVFSLVLASVLLVANLIIQSNFLTPSTLPATLANLAPLAIVAMATVPSIAVGGFDLSVGPIVSLTNVVFVAVLLPRGLGDPAVSIPILLMGGAFVSALSGALIAYLRVSPVIVGLGALLAIGGVAGKIQLLPLEAPHNWTYDLGSEVGPIPGALLAMAAPLVIWWGLRQTPLIRAIFSAGGDEATAYSAGANVAAIRIIAYAIGGMFAAIGGLALTALIHSSSSTQGLQYILIATAAVALGGTTFGGGRGSIVGGLLGAVCIYLMQTLLAALNIPTEWLNVVYGVVLVTAVVIGAQLSSPRLSEAAR